MINLNKLIKSNNVEINEGVIINADTTNPTLQLDGMTFLRSGITVPAGTYPLAIVNDGLVGSTVYIPNLYFRVA